MSVALDGSGICGDAMTYCGSVLAHGDMPERVMWLPLKVFMYSEQKIVHRKFLHRKFYTADFFFASQSFFLALQNFAFVPLPCSRQADFTFKFGGQPQGAVRIFVFSAKFCIAKFFSCIAKFRVFAKFCIAKFCIAKFRFLHSKLFSIGRAGGLVREGPSGGGIGGSKRATATATPVASDTANRFRGFVTECAGCEDSCMLKNISQTKCWKLCLELCCRCPVSLLGPCCGRFREIMIHDRFVDLGSFWDASGLLRASVVLGQNPNPPCWNPPCAFF